MLNRFLNRIIVGDCLEILRQSPDNSVDACFADPPFNLKKKYTSYDDRKALKDYLAWCEEWLSELVRVTKPEGSIFVHNIPKWLTYFADHLNQIAVFRHWISWDSMSIPLGKTLLPAHYGILYYTKRAKGFKFYDVRIPHKKCRLCDGYLKDYGGKKAQMHPFGTLASDVWTDIHRIRHNKRRDEHPCQLPIHLLERIVLMSSDPGDVILDPFIGTGTTAVAANAWDGITSELTLMRIMHRLLERMLQKKNLRSVEANTLQSSWVESCRFVILTVWSYSRNIKRMRP